MSRDAANHDDAEERLVAVIDRILTTVPTNAQWPPEARQEADGVAEELLPVLWELRRATPEASAVRRRYDEIIGRLHEWRRC